MVVDSQSVRELSVSMGAFSTSIPDMTSFDDRATRIDDDRKEPSRMFRTATALSLTRAAGHLYNGVADDSHTVYGTAGLYIHDNPFA